MTKRGFSFLNVRRQDDPARFENGAKELEGAGVGARDGSGLVTEADAGGDVDAVMEVDGRGDIGSVEDVFLASPTGDGFVAVFHQVVLGDFIDAHIA
jgi:hypothetical protein